MTLKRRRLILWLSVGIFLILAVLLLFYSQGYKIGKDFRISQRGGIFVSIPFSDSQIFINNKKEETTGTLNRGVFVSNMKTGVYSVLVAKDGYWPWVKNLEVRKGLVTEAKALLVPESPGGELLFKGKLSNIWASPYQKLLVLKEQKNGAFVFTFYKPNENIFLTTKPGTTESLITFKSDPSKIIWSEKSLTFKNEKGSIQASFDLSKNIISASWHTGEQEEISNYERFDKKKNQRIWWDPLTNEIFVEWLKQDTPAPIYICGLETCEHPEQIFKGNFKIRNIEFFPERKDAIIIALGNGIYALELDGRSGRLVYPLYKGKNPTFATISGEKNIYVIDDGALIKISLK
ncbi:hypothetical protein ACFLZC_02440 [Patescibacteria group bacterium]